MHIEAIPAYSDNYIWLFYRDNTQSASAPSAWVVDPGDAQPVLDALQQRNLNLEGVLLTHHHGDHDGGINGLLEVFPGLRVIGGLNAQSKHPTEKYPAGPIEPVLDTRFEILEVPGHTLDHIAFYAPDEGLLFCGDTLFAAGCGRIFEGTPAQMLHSLSKLAALPGDTRVFCAHEYTLGNLEFALAVEPDNSDLQARYKQAQQTRAMGEPTVPSLMSLELATNPFLRSQEESVAQAALAHCQQTGNPPPADTVEVFGAIRGWKDNF